MENDFIGKSNVALWLVESSRWRIERRLDGAIENEE